MNERLLFLFRLLGFGWLALGIANAQNDQLPPANDDPAAPLVEAFGDDEEFGFEQVQMLANVIEMIRQNYHDEDKVTYKRLINSALEGMLANLDPHCQFMHPELFAQMRRDNDGTYQGVGITIAFRSEVLTIVAVREDGPAARSGVLPGDQIIKINDFLADKLGMSEAMEFMRGKPGEPLKLTIRRPANNQLLEIEMVREVIQESTVKDVMMLEPRYASNRKIGYLRLTQFSGPTVTEMVRGLDKLESEGMEAFVLDLRNNPGGLLTSAVNTCGEFVGPGTVVLTTEGREAVANTRVFRTSPRKTKTRDYPVAILVNHGSASGAEVVSGALQDLNRAIVVGQTTFGKGSVQSIIPVPSSSPSGQGNAIRLTTAKYYTPSKRTIHENGVEPNIISTLTPKEEHRLMQYFRRDTLPPAELKVVLKWQDRQLARAVDALKGALVYAEVLTANQDSPTPEPRVPEKKPRTPKVKAKPKAAPTPEAEESDVEEKEEPAPAAEEPPAPE